MLANINHDLSVTICYLVLVLVSAIGYMTHKTRCLSSLVPMFWVFLNNQLLKNKHCNETFQHMLLHSALVKTKLIYMHYDRDTQSEVDDRFLSANYWLS